MHKIALALPPVSYVSPDAPDAPEVACRIRNDDEIAGETG
jgi:hypothetical protein